MKTNRPLLISIILNLALLGWILSHRPIQPQQIITSETAGPTTPTLAPVTQTNVAHNFTRPLVPAHESPFNWRQVESVDYKEYIANLRAIGCPEQTIKEIIIADVNDLFSTRRATITQTNHYEYWRANPVNFSEEQNKQLHELLTEKSDLLKTLGIESYDLSDLVVDSFRSQIESKDLEIEFLPEPKRQNLKDMLFRMAQQELAAGEGSTNAVAIEEQTHAAIKSLLTPDEFHDYELRTSVSASQLRYVLNEMQPTEQEFRTVFDYWNTPDTNPKGTAEYREAQQSSEAALRSLLGSNRFEIYLKGVKSLGYSK